MCFPTIYPVCCAAAMLATNCPAGADAKPAVSSLCSSAGNKQLCDRSRSRSHSRSSLGQQGVPCRLDRGCSGGCEAGTPAARFCHSNTRHSQPKGMHAVNPHSRVNIRSSVVCPQLIAELPSACYVIRMCLLCICCRRQLPNDKPLLRCFLLCACRLSASCSRHQQQQRRPQPPTTQPASRVVLRCWRHATSSTQPTLPSTRQSLKPTRTSTWPNRHTRTPSKRECGRQGELCLLCGCQRHTSVRCMSAAQQHRVS